MSLAFYESNSNASIETSWHFDTQVELLIKDYKSSCSLVNIQFDGMVVCTSC